MEGPERRARLSVQVGKGGRGEGTVGDLLVTCCQAYECSPGSFPDVQQCCRFAWKERDSTLTS